MGVTFRNAVSASSAPGIYIGRISDRRRYPGTFDDAGGAEHERRPGRSAFAEIAGQLQRRGPRSAGTQRQGAPFLPDRFVRGQNRVAPRRSFERREPGAGNEMETRPERVAQDWFPGGAGGGDPAGMDLLGIGQLRAGGGDLQG